MAVQLAFLGRLSDLDPPTSAPAPLDWPGLLAHLPSALAEAVADHRIRIAVNGQLLPDRTTLAAQDGDEIALLPPVSGG